MRVTGKPARRWSLLVGYLAIPAILMACGGLGPGVDTDDNPPPPDGVALQLQDGAVQLLAADGTSTSLPSESAFDLTASLESTDPWIVAGITLRTDESTRIDEGLKTGDLVRARGVIREDGAWHANSIERAAGQLDPIIILIGRVDSVDPWVVNGIELNVTAETEIQGEITPGMFVRVEILLLPDGTWEVLSIAPLGGANDAADCAAVTASVVSVEGNVIQLEGWPALSLGDDVRIETPEGGEGVLSPNQLVVVVVCPGGDGQVVIVLIIILEPEEEGGPVEGEPAGGKVLICHKPDKKGGHTISVSSSAVPAHLGHGDKLGACP